MNKFFYYYNPVCSGVNTPTVFDNDPYVTAIKEMFVSELQQLSYYIQKLQELDINMDLYTDKVIEFISVLIVNLDFKKESFFIIIEDLYNNKIMLKKMYISACAKAGIKPDILSDTSENLSSKDIILKVLNEKEKNSVIKQNNDKISDKRKYLYEIIIRLVLNACEALIELKGYNINFKEGKKQVLKLLNTANYPSLPDEKIIEIIKEFSEYSYRTIKQLYECETENFGPVISSEINTGRKKGKAILVSGKSF
jgi:hydroxylamine reductase (hybrid-cluster protein)